MSESKTKLLGTQVSKELHTQAHMTARTQNKSLSEWLRDLVKTNIDSRVSAFFLADDALFNKQ